MTLLEQLRWHLPLPGKRLRAPNRVQRIFRHYAEDRGYAAYAQLCRERLQRPLPMAPPGSAQASLESVGLADFRLGLGADLKALAGEMGDSQEFAEPDPRGALETGLSLTVRPDLVELLAPVLAGALDACLVHYFEAEYLVHTAMLIRTRASSEAPTVSFRWHCDKGPERHLKLLIYLNDHKAHQGGTEYLDLDDTAAVGRHGYVFGWTRRRTSRLDALERIAGKSLHVHRRTPDAGDAVLFQPARVLHRGLAPRTGDRLVLTLCLLPSPVPWRQALACGAATDLGREPKWHRHASELLMRFPGEEA